MMTERMAMTLMIMLLPMMVKRMTIMIDMTLFILLLVNIC